MSGMTKKKNHLVASVVHVVPEEADGAVVDVAGLVAGAVEVVSVVAVGVGVHAAPGGPVRGAEGDATVVQAALVPEN